MLINTCNFLISLEFKVKVLSQIVLNERVKLLCRVFYCRGGHSSSQMHYLGICAEVEQLQISLIKREL